MLWDKDMYVWQATLCVKTQEIRNVQLYFFEYAEEAWEGCVKWRHRFLTERSSNGTDDGTRKDFFSTNNSLHF